MKATTSAVPLRSHKQAPLSTNKHLIRWVEKMADLCKPASIHWVDGSESERDRLYDEMVEAGTFIRLNQQQWPGCYLARSDASDVARSAVLPLSCQCEQPTVAKQATVIAIDRPIM